MSKASDYYEDLGEDPLAQVLFDFIEELPAAKRLYADLYALSLAKVVREFMTKEE